MLDLNEYLAQLAGIFETGYTNFTRNATSFATMSLKQWIRIIAIIGGYLLLRPYLSKFAENAQKKQLSSQDAKDLAVKEEELKQARMRAEISPNALRGEKVEKEIQMPEESDSEDEGRKDVKWGAKAKKRQRALVERIIRQEEEARRRHIQSAAVDGWDSEEDKDIEQYLQ